jgi:GAF domain-containing protein/HAMP domain-containing protein
MTIESSVHTPTSQPTFKRSLARTAFIVILALTVIPVIIQSSVGYTYQRNLITTQYSNNLKNVVEVYFGQEEQAALDHQQQLNTMMKLPGFVQAVDYALRFENDPDNFYAARDFVLDKYSQAINSNETHNFFIVDTDGEILISSSNKSVSDSSAITGSLTEVDRYRGENIEDENYFQTLLQSDGKTIGLYGPGTIFPYQFALLTIKHAKDSAGHIKWILVDYKDAGNALDTLVKLNAIAPDSRSFFITNNGQALGLSEQGYLAPYELSAEETTALIPQSNNQVTSPSGEMSVQVLNSKDIDGNAVQLMVFQLPTLSSSIVMELSAKSLAAPVEQMRNFSFGLYAVVLVIAIIAATLLVRQFTKPLAELTQKTTSFAKGNFDVRVKSRRRDELGLLAYSFNQMADELSKLYKSLGDEVEARTRQIRTAAEVAQNIAGSINLDELLDKTASLVVERFDYYHAGVFMIDPTGTNAILRAAKGPAAKEMLAREHKLEVGSESIVGWVAANNIPRVVSDVENDPIHRPNPSLPDTRAEAGIPIASGGRVLGVLDVQSTKPETFDSETIDVLQTLAGQIAAAIENVSLVETTQVDLQELARLYRGSRQVTKALTEDEVVEATKLALENSIYSTAFYLAKDNHLELSLRTSPDKDDPDDAPGNLSPTDYLLLYTVAEKIEITPEEVMERLSGGAVTIDLTKTSSLSNQLIKIPRQMRCQTATFLPITRDGKLFGLLVVGARRKEPLSTSEVQPYANLTDLISTVLDKISGAKQTERRLAEMQALSSISQELTGATDLSAFCAALHEQIRRTIGNYSVAVALYNEETESINIPYNYETGENEVTEVSPFALGEGLTSVLIRTQQPLLIADNAQKQITELGAKQVGKPAKSWMGAPMIFHGQPIGAIIVQDTEKEKQFDNDDLRFLITLTAQATGTIYNTRLVEESRQSARQIQTAAEIARDISSSLDLDELLLKAVELIREEFNYYHSAVFIVDQQGEYAVIREATGEAGAQMKRTGHKLGVGSKSIVGFASGRGEQLVVNDTKRDATYYANPLLPNTRAEAALPLKLGDRILGVLDIQSEEAYAFTEDKLRTLQILADQLAVAVVNTQLFAETQEHLSQHRLLHHITTSAASGTTLDESLESTVKGLEVTLGGDRVSILLFDREKQQLAVRSAVGYSEEDIQRIQIPLGAGITGWVAAHRATLRIDDVTKDPRYIEVSSNTRSELAVPLVYRNELLGVLNVESELVNAYSDHDEELLGTLGGSLAAIIANARLLDQIRRQAERERMLYEVTSKIRQTTDMNRIVATTANELSKALGARRAQVKITQPNKPTPPTGEDEEPRSASDSNATRPRSKTRPAQ